MPNLACKFFPVSLENILAISVLTLKKVAVRKSGSNQSHCEKTPQTPQIDPKQ
jgi:hypothetical protein